MIDHPAGRTPCASPTENAMKTFLDVLSLTPLLTATAGRPEVAVAIIDGPVDVSHPDLSAARLTMLGAPARRDDPADAALRHGTAIAGVLAARRGSPAPALCPDCRFLVRPVFSAGVPSARSDARAQPGELAAALGEVLAAGARVINLSLELHGAALARHPALDHAFDKAQAHGALVVVAAGNAGKVGRQPLVAHPWVVPVGACDGAGRLLGMTNLGPTLGRRGLLAPGDLISTAPGGGYLRTGGTSVAAALVSGVAALLWSLAPGATAAEIRRALLGAGRRRALTPPRLDAAASWRQLALQQVS